MNVAWKTEQKTKLSDYQADVTVCLDTNIFFLLSMFLDLIFLFFIDKKEAFDCSHITYYMMWGYRLRLGKNRLEE